MRTRSQRALSQMIGKIVSGVVLTTTSEGHPRSQVFITFSDGTAFEFWSDDEPICTASGFDHCCLNDIVAIQNMREGTKVKVFRSPHEDPNQLQRDLLTNGS